MLKLSPRLQMAADMVRRGKTVCDVGTDHAYLPSYLILNGIVPNAVASDIGEGPLKNAAKTVSAYNLSGKISLRLSDGLWNIGEKDADDIVMCGMGGELMVRVISETPWLKNPEKHLICQPMSHAEDLRAFFIENGFSIEKETACEDSGRVYIAISAYYTGETADCPPGFVYYGRLPVKTDINARRYVEKQAQRLKNRAGGIENYENLAAEHNSLTEALKDIERMLENADS
ncbi:MAG: SAM-dependent methyltransferase [Clostridia bacterium]|nr:SAM-dependent methyltransferase [Clostridia bacterium]